MLSWLRYQVLKLIISHIYCNVICVDAARWLRVRSSINSSVSLEPASRRTHRSIEISNITSRWCSTCSRRGTRDVRALSLSLLARKLHGSTRSAVYYSKLWLLRLLVNCSGRSTYSSPIWRCRRHTDILQRISILNRRSCWHNNITSRYLPLHSWSSIHTRWMCLLELWGCLRLLLDLSCSIRSLGCWLRLD